MTANFLLALSEQEMRALDRVALALAQSGNPQVTREVDLALEGIPEGRLLLRRATAHLHGALLAAVHENDSDEGMDG